MAWHDGYHRNDGPWDGVRRPPEVRVLSARPARAGRAHACARCGAPIPAGAPHVRLALLVDGRFGCERTHLLADRCAAPAEVERREEAADEWPALLRYTPPGR